jgi:hypothetical protein
MVWWLMAHMCIMFSIAASSTPLRGKSFSLDWIGSDGIGFNWNAHIYWLLETTVRFDPKSPVCGNCMSLAP